MSCPSCSRSSRPACAGSCDSGVTAVIGTIMVLGITVIGIAATLFLGAPVIQQLQEEAAVDTMVGQFQNVRSAVQTLAVPPASRLTGISPADGTVSLTEGSHWLVLALYDVDADCVFTVDDWADWDASGATLTVTHSACLAAVTAPGDCTLVSADDDTWSGNCIIVTTREDPDTSLVQSWDGSTATLDAPLDPNTDYRIVLHGAPAGGVGPVLAEAWLLHSDRLAWDRGTSEVIYEGGTIFARENGALFRIAGPRVDEGDDGESLLLSLPTFQASAYGAIAGNGDHAVYTQLESRNLLVDTLGDAVAARLVTIDIHGDWAQAWCNTFLQRDVFADLAAEPYQDAADADRQCDAEPAVDDGVRSVRFDPSSPATFPFTLTQSVVTVALQV